MGLYEVRLQIQLNSTFASKVYCLAGFMSVSLKSVRILNSYYIIFKIQKEVYVILISTGIHDVRADKVHYLSRDKHWSLLG